MPSSQHEIAGQALIQLLKHLSSSSDPTPLKDDLRFAIEYTFKNKTPLIIIFEVVFSILRSSKDNTANAMLPVFEQAQREMPVVADKQSVKDQPISDSTELAALLAATRMR
jgi:hypothetical protein